MKAFFYRLAAVLTYPDRDYPDYIGACLAAAPDCARELVQSFRKQVAGLDVEEAQELFTRTLDLNPVCSLELGWHLFGENYDRGLLMSRLRRELAAAGIDENGELPDHLTHALLLLAEMPPPRAEEFAGAIVVPALEKMLIAFSGKQNPYELLLQALAVCLEERYPGIRKAAAVQQQLPIIQNTESPAVAGRTHV